MSGWYVMTEEGAIILAGPFHTDDEANEARNAMDPEADLDLEVAFMNEIELDE